MREYSYELLNESCHYFGWRDGRSPINPARVEDIELILRGIVETHDYVRYKRVGSIEEFHIDGEYSLVISDSDNYRIYIRFNEMPDRVFTDDKYIDLPFSEMYNIVMSRL